MTTVHEPAQVFVASPLERPDLQVAQPALNRPFKVLIFNWDGTAVTNHREDAPALARQAERLLGADVWLVVVTGTNFPIIDQQFCNLIAPSLRRHLVICANRGSEAFTFDADGLSTRAYCRMANPEEDRALTATAEAVRDALVAKTGLDIRVVHDRVNRRMVDLIPLPNWADPPKSQVGALRDAVEGRLRDAGFAGGLRGAIDLAEEIASRQELRPHITCDVKHIEVGLTDKSDALAWIRRRLLEREGIALRDVLIVGNEFGAVGDLPGSDDRLRQGAGGPSGATLVSVGVEPNGVPPGVIHLGGGPAQFRRVLAQQVALRESDRRLPQEPSPSDIDRVGALLTVPDDPAWQLTTVGYDPAIEHEIESLFTIGNGFLGVRGSLEEATEGARPRTFVAGIFNERETDGQVPVLVSAPDWLGMRVFVDDEPFTIEGVKGDSETGRRILDLRRGVLRGEWRRDDPVRGSVAIRTLRFVSLDSRPLAVQLARIEVDQPCSLSLEAVIEHTASELVPEQVTPSLSTWRSTDGAHRLAAATHMALHVDRRKVQPIGDERASRRFWCWKAMPGHPATFLRLVTFAGDGIDANPAVAAPEALARAMRQSLLHLYRAHTNAWAARWEAGNVEIAGDTAAQRALRFAVYHLVSAANPEDDRASVGARGLTGDAYLGHVFWDSDVYLLPFYCHAWPEAARAMLLYRYRTLAAARDKAARLGYRGALYAWESADTGEEVTPEEVELPDGSTLEIRCGTQEVHISADIAYAVWRYWQTTSDNGFLLDAGAEILLETARFCASRAVLGTDGKYHIRGIIGPDEGHVDVDDDAYTNGMATWNLERGFEVAKLLASRWPDRWAELRARLDLTAEELDHWRVVSANLVTGHVKGRQLIEQFQGYFELADVERPPSPPLPTVEDIARVAFTQAVKQADVVMLLALLPERFTPAATKENFRYYEPRTAHGSSLSPAMHALVAARLGDVDTAVRYFRQTADIDLNNDLGYAAQGVHLGALGGLWMAAVLGFGGLSVESDGIHLDPHLPPTWATLRFPLRWRDRECLCELGRSPLRTRVTLVRGEPMVVSVGDLRETLQAGQAWHCEWDETDQRWKEVATCAHSII